MKSAFLSNAVKKKYIVWVISVTLCCLLVLTKSFFVGILLCAYGLFLLKIDVKIKTLYKIPFYTILIIGAMFFITELIYPSFAFILFYTIKNGQTIELEHYSVKMHFPKWFIGEYDSNVYSSYA
jgi:hypothetical protein